MEQQIKKAYVDECHRVWSIYKDKLRQYSIYDDKIMDRCEDYEIWSKLMREAKNNGVMLRGRDSKKIKERPIKHIFENYSLVLLKQLCKTYAIHTIIQYIYDELTSKIGCSI